MTAIANENREDGGEFAVEALRLRLAGRRIGCPLHFFPECDSTNLVAMRLAEEGAPEGTLVLAERQTAGRGRLRRAWQSPPGRNIYLSILLRPAIAPSLAAQITLTAGVAVAETIAAFCPQGVGLKWPNDVRIGGRKCCGILTEMRMAERAVEWVVVGIGLNVNMTEADFDSGFRAQSTSLREATGRPLARLDVAARVCEQLETWYQRFLTKGFQPVREQWLAHSEMAGRRVRIRFGDEIREGVVAGIDHDGALLIADPRGALQRITAGDATIMKE